ncbi:MAG: protein kinase [Isosphaerales bacterium]
MIVTSRLGSFSQPASSEQSARVLRILEDYMAVLERGGRPDPEGLLARHPDLADVLAVYLQDLEQLHVAAVNLRDSLPSKAGRTAPDPIPETECLGDFQIVREIGRGGMGIVYEAEQLSLGRRVALKVLPLAAALDPKQLQRFQVEAHAAACLHHTNIVPIHAVGCERGVPFYAMQLIEGRSLADLIRELRQLDGLDPATSGGAAGETAVYEPVVKPREPTTLPRLTPASPSGSSTRSRTYICTVARMGIQAAEALEHAHQRGVLHRDIKPANLLLDPQGTLWVTDFGLARLPGDVSLTATGDLLGTLRYMSPEQSLGKRALIDGRTDIYSLGVTLYELLTLQPAFDGKDRQAVLRQIADDEPRPVRRVNPSVPADLETILHKAIAKEPHSRYATAQELADDLRRFLEQKPIRARRPTVGEQVVKWGRRHPSVVVSTLIVLLLTSVGLTSGMVLIDRQRHKALTQQRRAETHLLQAREAVDQMLTEVGQDTLSRVPHMEPVRRALLEKALAFYEKFLVQEGDDPSIRLEAGRAYRRVGDIRRLLGQHDRACEAYRSSIAIMSELAGSRPSDLDCRRDLAASHKNLGHSLSTLGKPTDAEFEYRRASELRWDILERSSGNPDDRLAWAQDQGNLGLFYDNLGRFREAKETLRPVRDALERLADDFPTEPRYQSSLGGTLNNCALVAMNQDELIEARTLLEQADAHQQAALRVDPRNLQYRAFARNHQEMLAVVLKRLGKRDEAERILRQCISIGEGLASDFPLVPSYRAELAGSYGNLGELLREMGRDRREEASRVLDRAEKLFQSLVAEYPGVPDYRRDLARTDNNRGILLRNAQRWKDAEQSYQSGIGLGEALVAADPSNAADKKNLATWKESLAQLLAYFPGTPVYDPPRAVKLAQEAIKLVPERASYRKTLGKALYRAGNWRASIDAMEEAMHCKDGGKLDPTDRFLMAMAHWRLGEKDTARTQFHEATAEMAKHESQDEVSLRLRDQAAALFGLAGGTPTEVKESNHSK